MRIAINVHDAPFSSQASGTALRFARAAVAAGHAIERVFFFHNGVMNGNGLMVPPPHEASPQAGWVALAAERDIELAICITTALARGVVEHAARPRQHGLDGSSLHPAFVLVGLGQLIDAMYGCDRMITFSS